MKIVKSLLIFSITFGILAKEDLKNKELRWNWKKIDTSKIKFPKSFKFGFATSEYQMSGAVNCPDSNWAYSEREKNYLEHKSGRGCDHWNLYKYDIELLKEFNVNSYRFSIEWSKIEPREGEFNQDAIKHYHDLIDELIKKGITPSITLHHFTHPQWFEKLKGFEKEKNIYYFVRFATKMFKEYKDKVQFWYTFNEPGVYVFQAYIRGKYPPHKTARFSKAGKVTKNILKAHIETYNQCRSIEPNKEKAQIGIVHQIVQFEPYHKKSKLEKSMTSLLSNIFYDGILQFFITDSYKLKVPLFANVEYKYHNAKSTLDFIGLNYYSHVMSDWKSFFKPNYRDGEIATDMPYGIYAEGLYRAINQVSTLNVPIYITENGIADAKDDRRELYIKQYLYAVSKAIKDGYDVRGYYYWSLMDNFEWDMGYPLKFGLYQVNFNTLERTLRKGGYYYKKVIFDHNKRYKIK